MRSKGCHAEKRKRRNKSKEKIDEEKKPFNIFENMMVSFDKCALSLCSRYEAIVIVYDQ
jgi:hypothetical protein